MTGSARIRDPHSATVRAIKPVYVKNFNSLARVTTDRAFLARRASPGREEKAQRPRGGRKCRPAREASAPTALIKCCTLPLPLQSYPAADRRPPPRAPYATPFTRTLTPAATDQFTLSQQKLIISLQLGTFNFLYFNLIKCTRYSTRRYTALAS